MFMHRGLASVVASWSLEFICEINYICGRTLYVLRVRVGGLGVVAESTHTTRTRAHGLPADSSHLLNAVSAKILMPCQSVNTWTGFGQPICVRELNWEIHLLPAEGWPSFRISRARKSPFVNRFSSLKSKTQNRIAKSDFQQLSFAVSILIVYIMGHKSVK